VAHYSPVRHSHERDRYRWHTTAVEPHSGFMLARYNLLNPTCRSRHLPLPLALAVATPLVVQRMLSSLPLARYSSNTVTQTVTVTARP
jgi:hypothetical protein